VNVAGAVVAAVAAAIAFALAALLQQRAAIAEPADLSLRPSLLVALLRRPLWLAGVGVLVAGYGLQACALAFGPVALVQPLITTELVFAVPIAMTLRHGSPGWREWLGVAFVVGGVSLFLTVASPAAGTPSAGVAMWVLVIGAAAVAVGAALDIARGAGPRRRAMALAMAAGIAFAVLAVLTKTTVSLLGIGLTAALTAWQTYAVVVVGILGLLFSQSAYQAGPLTFSMPVVAVVEPTVAVLIGSTVLDEHVQLGGGALGFEVLGACVAAVGVVLLATSRVVLSLYEQREPTHPQPDPEGERAHPKIPATSAW
jgi:drug/metabolite transporter (DMT)-like permease